MSLPLIKSDCFLMPDDFHITAFGVTPSRRRQHCVFKPSLAGTGKCALLQPGENRMSLGQRKSKRTFSAFFGTEVCVEGMRLAQWKSGLSSKSEVLHSISSIVRESKQTFLHTKVSWRIKHAVSYFLAMN